MLPTSPDTVDKIFQYTAVAANCLQDIAATAQIPFLDSVCTISLTIIPIVQDIKFQKDRCLDMMEKIHQLLCGLTNLCIHADNIRSPKVLNQIAQSTLTLQKFHSCLRAQRELGTIKRLFKQNEIIAQLDGCAAALKTTLEIFMMEYGFGITSVLVDFRIDSERRHQELLELISSQSGSMDNASSFGRSSLNTSSGSLSLLPACPKMLHGRDSELKDLLDSLLCDPARVAILGPGGMGKTTLAMAALHDDAIIEKYNLRHFISCESSTNCGDLVTHIGLHLGLDVASSPLSKAIVQHFRQCGPCLVVLDNFETPWEAPCVAGYRARSRTAWEGEMESAVSLSPGASFPSASRQIFVEVADEPGSGEELAFDHLLDLTGSLPLAVSLMANVASFEGYSSTLARWQTENTSLLSEGHDKRSNLEKSIAHSLSSPRISSSPHAKNLLSLLSLLPDGIRPQDILAGKVPIRDVLNCQSVLLGTSLAYMDVKGRLHTLSPVREYIRRIQPPPPTLSRPLRTYFQELLELWRLTHRFASNDLVPTLLGYLGNINQLILEGLSTDDKPAWIAIGDSIITLDRFSIIMMQGDSPLLQKLPQLIEATGDASLRWKYAGNS
ncbi:hypothetical protein B0H13DRAFT_2368582 [Mycena leptocephala]|nr:hypothetical protein B0H13DRAFT_2382338 [Mycena leptocephala]KAJ7836747.1 hypothetical protein B0H13DRAFT_2368582 [Mycena leptocephala]